MDQIKDIIPQIIGHWCQGLPAYPGSLQSVWISLSDGKFAKDTIIERYADGELVICAENSARLFQLNNHKGKILKALKNHFPDIKKINFKIGKIR